MSQSLLSMQTRVFRFAIVFRACISTTAPAVGPGTTFLKTRSPPTRWAALMLRCPEMRRAYGRARWAPLATLPYSNTVAVCSISGGRIEAHLNHCFSSMTRSKHCKTVIRRTVLNKSALKRDRRTHEIAFAELDPAMAQDVVGGGAVEIEIGQRASEQQ